MTKFLPIALLGACSLIAQPLSSSALTLSELEYWAGAGTNRAALVIDWGDDARPRSVAWGFRWDGTATSGDMLRALAGAGAVTAAGDTNTLVSLNGADSRLFCVLTDWGLNTNLFALGYDTDGDGASYSIGIEQPGSETGTADDPDDNYHEGWFDGKWHRWIERGGSGGFVALPRHGRFDAALNPLGEWQRHDTNMDQRVLHDGAWDAWRFSTNASHAAPPRYPRPALHYPHAVEVVSYTGASGVGTESVPPYHKFNDPDAALGRPTIDTIGDDVDISTNMPVPVVPLYAAFRSSELVTIGNDGGGSPGELVLRFDHRVLDSALNPYGVDVIVWGNSFYGDPGGGSTWTNGNPDAAAIPNGPVMEKGLLSVSQDGTNWVSFSGGPYPDHFSPTLGRTYDTQNVDTVLGEWNKWWGAPTDPTYPVAPSLQILDFVGKTVGEVARLYRGSAGGTGFDISSLPLAADESTGRKWFQYLKVGRGPTGIPEVDAVADVSPVRPFDLWRLAHFPWLGDPRNERPDADPDGDRVPNLIEYALGRNPTNFEAGVTLEIGPCTNGGVAATCYPSTNTPDVAVRFVTVQSLLSTNWTPAGIDHVVTRHGSAGRLRVTGCITQELSVGFIRLEVLQP